jgi:integrase
VTRDTPYFWAYQEGQALGYRRLGGPSAATARAGTWLARLYRQDRGYERHGLGSADDFADADGVAVLDFIQAQNMARAWCVQRLAQLASGRHGGPDPARLTVRDAVSDYCERREAADRHGRGTKRRDTRQRLTRHVLSDPVADTLLTELTDTVLRGWRARLTARDTLGPAGVNRLLNDFRAALNLAVATYRRRLPAELAGDVKASLTAVPGASRAREIEPFSAPEIVRLVEAAFEEHPAFGRLVLVMAATGARFSQVARITVADVELAKRRIRIPASHKGRSRERREPLKVPVGADVLARLAPVLEARTPDAPLLLGPNGRAWSDPAEMTRPWRRALAGAGLPIVIPYVLRGSSIVRMLRAGTPIRFVAQAHDTSVAMIERHYSRFITSEVEDAVREAIVPLTAPLPEAAG